MAVDVLEIKTAAAVPMVELAVAQAPRRAADCNVLLFNARKNGVELLVVDVKRQMMAFELVFFVEQQRQRFVDLHRREISGTAAFEAENAGEELGRRRLVMRRDDGVIKRNCHDTRLSARSFRTSGTIVRSCRRRGRSRRGAVRICRSGLALSRNTRPLSLSVRAVRRPIRGSPMPARWSARSAGLRRDRWPPIWRRRRRDSSARAPHKGRLAAASA